MFLKLLSSSVNPCGCRHLFLGISGRFMAKAKRKARAIFANPSDNKGLCRYAELCRQLLLSGQRIIMWFKIVVSCLPAAVIGLAFNDWIEAHLMNYVIVALMLIIMVSLFIIIENYNKTRTLSATKIKRDYLEKCAVYRCFSSSFHRTELPVWEKTIIGGYPAGMLERAGIGVHVFPLPFRLCSARAF